MVRKLIEDLTLSEGESQRMNCPLCGGNNTFTVTKQEGVVVYNCYKLGCGSRGAVPVGVSAEDVAAYFNRKGVDTKPQEAVAMEIPLSFTFNTTDTRMQRFVNKWGLHNVNLMYDMIDHRVVFPIHNASGLLVDAVGRTIVGAAPKWLRYTGKGDYYTHGTSKDTAVVVEDSISAVAVHKCSKDATGVAILGTSLTETQRNFLTKFRRVIIALDPDAMSKTIEFTQQLRLYVDDVKAMYLTDDIKYREPQDVETLLEMIHE